MSTSNTAQDPQDIERAIERLGSQDDFRSHTHRPLHKIIEQQGIGPIERVLLWLAKTDLYVLNVVPNNCRGTLVSLGMMVLFTSLLAFASALYTSITMVVGEEHIVIGVIIAMLYAFGIMIIDREIVGASSSWSSLLIRFVFALLVATAMSWPVKIRMFEGKVEEQLIETAMERQAEKVRERDQLIQQGQEARRKLMEVRDRQIADLQRLQDAKYEQIATLVTDAKREAQEKNGCGPKCNALQTRASQEQEAAQEIGRQVAALNGDIAVPAEIQSRIDRLKTEIEAATSRELVLAQHRDILSKWEAMRAVEDEMGPEFQIVSWFVLLFFLGLEMVPLLLKLSLAKTEYQYYIEARTNLNNQKIIAITNYYMDAMTDERTREAVLREIPPEITDMIAWLIEDESRAHEPNYDPRTAGEVNEQLRARAAALNDARMAQIARLVRDVVRTERGAPVAAARVDPEAPAAAASERSGTDATVTENPPPQDS